MCASPGPGGWRRCRDRTLLTSSRLDADCTSRHLLYRAVRDARFDEHPEGALDHVLGRDPGTVLLDHRGADAPDPNGCPTIGTPPVAGDFRIVVEFEEDRHGLHFGRL